MAKVKVINKRQGADLIGANFRNVASETIFSFGNFTVDTNFTTRTVKKYNNTLSSFVKPITLEDLNLSEEDSKHVFEYSQEVLLNFDKSDLSTYARFGSLTEVLNVSIQKIILNFPASLYVTYQQSSFVNLMSVTNYNYSVDTDVATFTVPTAAITNKFGLVTNYGNSQLPEDIALRNLNISFEEYVIWRSTDPSNNDFEILEYTGNTASIPNIKLKVKGNPFPELTGTTQGQFRYHIKPKPIHFNRFKEKLSVLEAYLINEKVTGVTTSGYKTVFKIPYPSDSGDVVYSNKEIVWTSFDQYNIDVDGFGFNSFFSDITFVGDLYDQFKSDLMARMLVPSSIFENDNTADEKMKKLIRLYGASFDNLKVFIDSLVTINKLSYNKTKNVPDVLVKNLASTMGWEPIALVHEDDLLEGFFSTVDKKPDDLLPPEVDIELWRRILINTNYLFKTTGTREAIMTMLLMVGIPEPFINITEYVYTVTQKINPNTVTVDLSDLPSSTLPYDNNGYPIAPKETKTFYFQVSGNSDSGQAYMDVFRQVGFVLNRTIDNKKSWPEEGEIERIHSTTPNYYQKDSKLVLNTKEVDVTLDIARGIEYDVYKYNVENNFPLTSTGVTKPFLYINIPFTYDTSATIFTIPETPQGDIQVNFNGITLVKGSSAGDTTADYYINPLNIKEAILIGGTAQEYSNGYKDVITLTYAKDQSTGGTYAQVNYVVSKITVNPDGIIIPLVEEPLGEVQLVVDGKTMSKSTTLFTGDYVINPANAMELIVVNNELKNYLIAHPVVTISYIKSNVYEPILKKSEVYVVNSFSDIKFYYNSTLNKYTYLLDFEPPDDKAVKIIINGLTLQNGTDFTLNSLNRKQVLFNTNAFSLGYVINAFYITASSTDQPFNLGDFKLPNMSQITFLEYLEIINRRLINVKNRKTITDHEGGMYPTVQKLYEEYLKREHAPNPLPPSNGYNFGNVYPFINRFNTYFHKFIEQLLSSTIILKKGGVLIRNTAFTKQKFTYRRGVNFDMTLGYLGDDGSEFKKRVPNIHFNYMWSGTTCVIVPDATTTTTTTTTVMPTATTTTTTTTLPTLTAQLGTFGTVVRLINTASSDDLYAPITFTPAYTGAYTIKFNIDEEIINGSGGLAQYFIALGSYNAVPVSTHAISIATYYHATTPLISVGAGQTLYVRVKTIAPAPTNTFSTSATATATISSFNAVGYNSVISGINSELASGSNRPGFAHTTVPVNCLLAGQKIMTGVDTFKNVEELKFGDSVYTMNPVTNEFGLYNISNAFKKTASKWFMIQTVNGQITKCSPTHLFMVNGIATKAESLKYSDKLMLLNEEKNGFIETKILNIVTINSSVDVFNIEVDDAHTYISENGVYHHNKAEQ